MSPVASVSAGGPLASIIGWLFLPTFCASLLLRLVYSVFPQAKPLIYELQPRPEVVQAANAKAQRHQRLAHTFVVVGYLAYTLSAAYQSLLFDANHYRLLGMRVLPFDSVPEEIWERESKQQWRALVRVAHPDKVGAAGETAFVAMRTAYETLSDSLKKDAYDRFGQEIIVSCAGKCATQREYIKSGVFASSGFYIVVLGTLFVVSMTRQNEASAYWRYLFLAALGAAEYTLVTRPLGLITSIGAAAGLAPWQIVVFLHHLYIALTMGVNHLSPLLFPPPPTKDNVVEIVGPYIGRMRQLAIEADAEAYVTIQGALQPLLEQKAGSKGDAAAVKRLKQIMVDSMIDSSVRADEGGAELWRNAMRRRQGKVPKQEDADEMESEEDAADEKLADGPPVKVKAEPSDEVLTT